MTIMEPAEYVPMCGHCTSAEEAEAWIVKHKSQVEAGTATGQWFRKAARPCCPEPSSVAAVALS